MSMVRVRLLAGETPIVTRDLPPGVYRIGLWRGPQDGVPPDIPVAGVDDFISREHCHLIVEDDYVEIADGWPSGLIRSTFGIHVNGVRVDRLELEEGDLIALGDPTSPSRHLRLNVEGVGRAATWAGPAPTFPMPTPAAGSARIPAPPLEGGPTADTRLTAAAASSPADTGKVVARPVVSPAVGDPRVAEPAPEPEPGPAPESFLAPPHSFASAADATEIATREALLEIVLGLSREQTEAASLPDDRAAYRGRKFHLHQHQQEIIIGREPSCDMVIADPDPAVNKRISRQHARIEYRPEEGIFRLYNRSGNGTIVRRLNHPVMDDCILNDHDLIIIGNTTIQIQIIDIGEGVRPKRRGRWVPVLGLLAVAMILTGIGGLVWGAMDRQGPGRRTETPSFSTTWSQSVAEARRTVRVAAGRLAGGNALHIAAVASDGGVNVLDGATGNPKWGQPVQLGDSVSSSPAVADLDGDRVEDVLVTGGTAESRRGKVMALAGATGQTLWEGTPGCGGGGCFYPLAPALADLTGDGKIDVVVVAQSLSGGTLVAVDGASGQELWTYRDSAQRGAFVVPPLLVPTASGPEVVVAADDGTLYLIKGADGTLIQKATCQLRPLGPLVGGDLGGDGTWGIGAVNAAYHLRGIDAVSGADLGAKQILAQDTFGLPEAIAARAGTAPLAADLDGDGSDEWVVPNPGCRETDNAILAVKGRGLLKLWGGSVGKSIVLAPPAAADLDGDLLPDVLLLASSFNGGQLELVALGGKDGKELARLALDQKASVAAPLVGDFDGDGGLDCVVGSDGGMVSLVKLGVSAGKQAGWLAPRGDVSNTGRAAPMHGKGRGQGNPIWVGLLAGGSLFLLIIVALAWRNRWSLI